MAQPFALELSTGGSRSTAFVFSEMLKDKVGKVPGPCGTGDWLWTPCTKKFPSTNNALPGNLSTLMGPSYPLENGLGFNFQGNRWHGASGPIAPESAVDISWAYRFDGISYPPGEMVGPQLLQRKERKIFT